MTTKTRFIAAVLLAIALSARADQTIFQPTTFASPAKLTINSGVDLAGDWDFNGPAGAALTIDSGVLTITDPSVPASVVLNLSGLSATTHQLVIAGSGDSSAVQAFTGASNEFLTFISSIGVQNHARPTISNLSNLSAAARIVGSAAGSAAVTELKLGTNLSMTSDTINATGGVSPAGSSGDYQFNNGSGALGASSVLNFNAGQVFATDVAFVLRHAFDTTKIASFDLSNMSTATTIAISITDASNIIPAASSAVSNQFVTGLGTNGIFTRAQPAFTDLSGSATDAQVPNSLTLTTVKDTNSNTILGFTPTASAVNYLDIFNATSASPIVTLDAAGASTNVSLKLIPKGAGFVSLHASAADITVNTGNIIADVGTGMTIGQGSTDTPLTLVGAGTGTGNAAIFSLSNIAGSTSRTVNIAGGGNSTTVVSDTGASNNFLTAVSADGAISKARPTIANLTDLSAASKLIGSGASGAGVVELTLGTNLSMSGTTLNATGGAVAGSDKEIQFNDGGSPGADADFKWDKTSNILTLPGGTSDARVKIGSLELNSYAVNNSWFGDNTYFNGSNWKYRVTGPAGLFYFDDVEGQFRFFPVGTGGANLPSYFGGVGDKAQLKINADNTVAIGGAMSVIAGNYVGSVLVAKGTAAEVGVAGNYELGWTNTSYDASAPLDIGLYRNGAGVVEVNNGTPGQFRDLKVDEVNAVTGYQVNGAAGSNKILKGNGTDFVASTETYAAPGASGNVMTSDGTNFVSSPPAIGGAAVGHGDSDYTITSSDRTVYTNAAFTASRVWTLPAANSVAAGVGITVVDLQGTVTAGNRLVITRAGSDKIWPQNQNQLGFNSAGQSVTLVSDGTSKWFAKSFQAGAATIIGQVPQFPSAGNDSLWQPTVYGLPTPAPGASGKVIQSNSATGSQWSSATWPTTAGTSGNVVTSDGTNFVSSPPAGGVSMTTHGDSDYTILTTDRVVVTNATFTASRTWTLPAASAVSAGTAITVADLQGGIGSAQTLTITAPGSDRIFPANVASYVLSSTGAALTLVSNGVSKWQSYVSQPGQITSSGQFMQGISSVWRVADYQLPTSAGSSGKMMQSNGSNIVMSTPLWPTTAGTSGNVVTSDGTNFVSSPPVVGGSITGHGDSNYTILTTDRVVVTNAAFTTTRTWTLPAANALAAGTTIIVIDKQGTLTSSNTLTVSRAGSDTMVPSGGTSYNMQTAFQGLSFMSDGTSKWIVSPYLPGDVNTGGFLQSFATGNGGWAGSSYGLPTTNGNTGQLLRVTGAATTGFTTATYPNTASTSGKVAQSDGTNIVMSTATWPTSAGAAGYSVRSDGTNFSSYPLSVGNASIADQTGFASDTYLTDSAVTVTAGDFKTRGTYYCKFDMTKTGAGTATPIINVRIGTAGTTSDTSQMTFTFGAGTAVADTGTFELWINFRASGASAVIAGSCKAVHNLATTGLFNNAAAWTIVGTTSGSFNATAATKIGVSFNGGTSFSGTVKAVQAILNQ